MRHRKIGLILLSIVFLLALSGCVKGEIKLEVNDDGSGIYTITMGMTQQAMALARSQDEDPIEKATQEAIEKGIAQDVKRWADGEYEWVERKINFRSPDDLNQIVSELKNFHHFSLKRQQGWFKDQFILDAQLKGTDEEIENQEMPINPAAFIKLQMSAKLPGEIIETNGATDINTGAIVWTIDFSRSTNIHAVSEVWNWFNISLIGVGIGGLGLLVIAVLGGVVYVGVKQGKLTLPGTLSKNKAKPAKASTALKRLAEKSSTIDFSTSPPPELLRTINARLYLEQVNQQICKKQGQITETFTQIELKWPGFKSESSHDKITIKAISQNAISINGKRWPATEEDVKKGLIVCLKAMNKL